MEGKYPKNLGWASNCQFIHLLMLISTSQNALCIGQEHVVWHHFPFEFPIGIQLLRYVVLKTEDVVAFGLKHTIHDLLYGLRDTLKSSRRVAYEGVFHTLDDSCHTPYNLD